MNDIFDVRRFLHVLVNDLKLLQARRIAFASLGLAGIGMLMYLLATLPEESPGEVAATLFSVLLLGGGAIFTSMIYNDMHDPLERFHYLMLPCSNLERFLSRYLITAPLFVLYAIVLYSVFEPAANFLCAQLRDGRTVAPLDLDSPLLRGAIVGYFVLHVFIYTGAIWFRSYALMKTLFASFVLWASLGTAFFLALRLFYLDSFISLFETNPAGPYFNFEYLHLDSENPQWYYRLLLWAFLLWILFLAYLGLKEHEVRDGL